MEIIVLITQHMEAGLILLVMGCIFILVGVSILQKRKRIRTNGITTEGVVFTIEGDTSSRGNYVFPVIRFTTLKDEWITERTPLSYKPGQYNSGEKVTVIYEAHNPKNFILSDTTNQVAPYLFIITGCLLMIVGLSDLIGIVQLEEFITPTTKQGADVGCIIF